MSSFTPAESLHRLVKEALDSGVAATLSEADSMFHSFRVCFSITAAEATDAHHQAALLTGVALARRVFLGGVSVLGPLHAPLAVPLPLGETLGDAVETLGAFIGKENASDEIGFIPLTNMWWP